MGAKRWIDLAGIKIQPSEPAKISIVLLIARYLDSLKAVELNSFKVFPSIIAAIIPIILIIKQPDLGTGMLALMVASCMFFASGIKPWKFGLVGSIGCALAPLIWSNMHNYQKQRVLIFLDPELDPLGSGYNIIQSKIAVGSGGFWGKGINQGTQSHLDFLPEHQTDFIFACMSEEFGFVCGFLLLILYSMIIVHCLAISINSRSRFTKLTCVGITSIFFFHIFINIAMVLGLVPVVGVPLPFISYGGTMTASMLIGFGLIMNAHIHRQTKL